MVAEGDESNGQAGNLLVQSVQNVIFVKPGHPKMRADA
jgi:hypothetical protein